MYDVRGISDFIFIWTTNTKNQQTKPSYIYSTTTNQITYKESIATANELAGIESLKDHNLLKRARLFVWHHFDLKLPEELNFTTFDLTKIVFLLYVSNLILIFFSSVKAPLVWNIPLNILLRVEMYVVQKGEEIWVDHQVRTRKRRKLRTMMRWWWNSIISQNKNWLNSWI